MATAMILCLPCLAEESRIPVVISDSSPSGWDEPHSLSSILAQGYYDLESSVLSLSFLQSVGVCQITVTNTVGDYYIDSFNSDAGLFTMQLSGESGLYIVSVVTADGVEYMTQFFIL